VLLSRIRDLVEEPPHEPSIETQYGRLEALLIDAVADTSFDDGPQGHAVLLLPQRDDRLGSHSGPVSTRDLPGVMRYRRDDEAA
jgi:hypothetical protein